MFDLNTITCPVSSADMKSTKWFTTNLYNLTQKLGNGLFKCQCRNFLQEFEWSTI